jgi:hypothetical protein
LDALPEGNICEKLWFSSMTTKTWLELGNVCGVKVTFTSALADCVVSARLVTVTVCGAVVAGAV